MSNTDHMTHITISLPNIECLLFMSFIIFISHYGYRQYKQYIAEKKIMNFLFFFNSLIVGIYSGFLCNLVCGHHTKNIDRLINKSITNLEAHIDRFNLKRDR